MEVRLLTTQDEYDTLHHLADTRAATIRVGKEALSHLLIDHGVALAALQDKGVKISSPLRQRVRLQE
jgi:hypothetical protein